MTVFDPAKLAIILLLILASHAYPQSQALDAEIDGIVTDPNGAVVQNAAITTINIGTGAIRTASTNESGIFRFPILSLGSYTLTAKSSGFKRFERRGIILSAGQTASVAIVLEPGSANETVTVTSDAAIADGSRFSVGRLVNSRAAANLPLVFRNPYNFILLQPGVNGRTVRDPLAVDLSAGGLRRRVVYLLDGNYDNDSNTSGFRLNLISETFVKEMQLLSSGYSAEFGNTAGAVVNVITPSGTNDLNGNATFLLRPARFSAKPFGFDSGTASNVASYGFTGAVGGPIIKDRWHFYAAYEWTRRNSIAPITVTDANRNALIAAGLRLEIFANTGVTSDTLPYLLVRTDAKVSGSTRINFRYNRFDAGLRNMGVGGLSTSERSANFIGYDHAFAFQAVTSWSQTLFNEFRFQFAKRVIPTVANELSGSGPTITINGVANFGPNPNLGTVGPHESVVQFNDSVSKSFNSHLLKVGGGINFIRDHPTGQMSAIYTFGSLHSYLNARNGTDRKSYNQYSEVLGDSRIPYGAEFVDLFINDDIALSQRLKLAVGLRYDLYVPPAADPDSPVEFARTFRTDRNNFAPRLGLAYRFRDGKYSSVLRFGGGMYYDPPLLAMYQRALLNNGNPRYLKYSFSPGDLGAPAFPDRLAAVPSVTATRDIDAVSPDFATMYAVTSNVQIEQALSENVSITIGYIFSIARQIPVYRNINCRPTGGTLADGRPLYGTIQTDALGTVRITGCSDPIDRRFKKIMMAESAGSLNYDGGFLQLNKRFSRGLQLTANYTLSRARDDAPEDNGPGATQLSDPSNRALDRGNAYGDVSGVFNLSLVARPSLRSPNRWLNVLLNDNQLAIIIIADSGENFNRTTGDLNRDGVTGGAGPDRPVGVKRNSARIPPFCAVDARYSRYFKFGERYAFELYAEAANVFNTRSVSTYDNTSLPSSNIFTSPVNPLTGELQGPLPDVRELSANWRGSRQIQFGAKIHF